MRPKGDDVTTESTPTPGDSSHPTTNDAPGPTRGPTHQWWRGPLILLIKLAVAAAAIVFVVRLVRRVDWSQVGDAIANLEWWQIAVLLALVLLRQTVNATPLIFLVPKIGLRRAVMNGLSGTLITTFMPPPAEVVLRLSMFKSWGIDASFGAAALALNTLVFYMARFAAPVVGLIIVIVAYSPESVYVWAAIGGGLVSLLLVLGLTLVARGERLADRVGRNVGRTAHRVRKSVDPDEWAAALVKFQRDSTEGLARRVGGAALSLLGFLFVDGTIVALSLRFLGVTSAQVPYLAILAAFLCVFPLSVFPFAGIGILDASLIVLLTARGALDQADLVAALVVWRTATLVVPLIPGLGAFALWRNAERRKQPVAQSAPVQESDEPSAFGANQELH